MRPALRDRSTMSGFTLLELVVVIVTLCGLKTAYGLAHATGLLENSGYTSPYQMSLFNITRCDGVDRIIEDPSRPKWMGHHMALASLSEGVFADPAQMAGSGDTISFTSGTDRVVTSTKTLSGITWSATPAF